MRALFVLALAGAACGSSSSTGPSTVTPAATAPSVPTMTYTLTTGATWTRGTDAAGKLLVIDVWASWCKPCLKGMVRVERIAAAYPDVAVLGLSIDEDDAAMRAFLAEAGVAYPNARVPVTVVDAPPLSVSSLPAIVVVDRQGRIRWNAQEMKEGDYERLGAVLAELRAE